MRAGRLRHRVTLQSPQVTRDDHGQAVRTWRNERGVAAAVEPLRGREYIAARQVAAETLVRVVIRYWSRVSTDWRVVHGTATYEIESVINVDGRCVEMQLMCRDTQ